MISSCWTFRLNRRRALSIDSPSCTRTSATRYTPSRGWIWPCEGRTHLPNVLGYHRQRRILGHKVEVSQYRSWGCIQECTEIPAWASVPFRDRQLGGSLERKPGSSATDTATHVPEPT